MTNHDLDSRDWPVSRVAQSLGFEWSTEYEEVFGFVYRADSSILGSSVHLRPRPEWRERGPKYRAVRCRLGLSLGDAARQTGLTLSEISALEHGTAGCDSAKFLALLLERREPEGARVVV